MHSHDSTSPAVRAGRWLPAALAMAALAACGGSGDGDGNGGPGGSSANKLEIRTLSTRADWVTDGDALVELTLPAGVGATGLAVDVDGRDVTSAFTTRADGRTLGLVTGLKSGANVLNARTAIANRATHFRT